MRRSSITSSAFRVARLSATARAVTSGNPTRIVRRARNIGVGRGIARAGVWRRSWR